jgi:predicted aminopeptidase
VRKTDVDFVSKWSEKLSRESNFNEFVTDLDAVLRKAYEAGAEDERKRHAAAAFGARLRGERQPP